jgi:hypothetical protein
MIAAAHQQETRRQRPHRWMTRRRLLGTALFGIVAAACGRVAQRQEPAAEPTSTALDDLRAQATGMVADALNALHTFDAFAAYRVSVTPSSGMRTPGMLAWDPPTSAAWQDATHTSRTLHDRANQLFQSITTASIDPALWRTQRTLADATHDLLDLADALQAYRDRIDRLPPGDASGALELLDRAWNQWDGVAARWGMARSEPIECQS